MAVKDNIPVAGVPMRNGSYRLEGYTADFDATVITRILDAGKEYVFLFCFIVFLNFFLYFSIKFYTFVW